MGEKSPDNESDVAMTDLGADKTRLGHEDLLANAGGEAELDSNVQMIWYKSWVRYFRSASKDGCW